jgi:hypothetical protein
MSTTVVISPVAASGVAGSAILPLALVVGTGLWAAARAIAAQDETCAKLLAKSREDLRRERLAMLELRSADLGRLTRSALEARFQATSLPGGAVRLAEGSRVPVWAARTADGIQLMGEEASLRRLLVANTASRAVEHLRSRGFQVETGRMRTGETALVGRPGAGQGVEVVIGSSGEAHVDLTGFRGKECERVARDLATAIEGTITSFCPKSEYYGGAAVKVGETERA